MLFESEYKLENVAATAVASGDIDATFRSSTIGESRVSWLYLSYQVIPRMGYSHEIL